MSALASQLEVAAQYGPSLAEKGQSPFSSAPGADSTERGQSLTDLAQIIQAYNRVTENLQASHEALRRQVERLQEQLASADAQLQRSKRLAALGEMAAGIAHEIRNPLAAIQLYAGMLVQDLEALRAAASGQTARKIAAAVRGLDGIVNDVLTFARELSPRAADLPLTSVLARVIEAHRPAIESAGIVLEQWVDPEDLSVCADPDLLHQALLNLVRNAVDAMGERRQSQGSGGSSLKPQAGCLALAARADPDNPRRVVLTVRDTGPGIAEADIDRIFNPFFTTRATGTGLGLAIVHRIVDAHGGSISVHNDSSGGGGGAVFEVRLPGGNSHG